MIAHSWADIWKLFLELMGRESVVIQIGVGLGVAFIAVMALEGVRASFFPRRIVEGVTLRSVAAPSPPASPPSLQQDDMRAAWMRTPAPVAFAYPQPVPYMPQKRETVNAYVPRRSSPQRLRVVGPRKPS